MLDGCDGVGLVNFLFALDFCFFVVLRFFQVCSGVVVCVWRRCTQLGIGGFCRFVRFVEGSNFLCGGRCNEPVGSVAKAFIIVQVEGFAVVRIGKHRVANAKRIIRYF